MKRRTKIVCTIGPASSSRKILRQMIVAGMDVARLNFSHGTHEEKTAAIQAIREISSELGVAVGVLADLPGPKMRLGTMANAVTLKPRQCVTLTPDCTSNDGSCLPLPIPALIAALRPGDRIFLNDGIVYIRVKDVVANVVRCQVVVGGEVSSHKGVAVPDTRLDLPAITEADLEHAAARPGDAERRRCLHPCQRGQPGDSGRAPRANRRGPFRRGGLEPARPRRRPFRHLAAPVRAVYRQSAFLKRGVVHRYGSRRGGDGARHRDTQYRRHSNCILQFETHLVPPVDLYSPRHLCR